ncbi:MAG: hypothetical protein IPM79_39815 [Polyangiaceae bacterium]|nr:hypothetical protein [Polyangiaceae bacterium]
MSPSKSTLDRLPKELAERVNDDRASFEAELRDAMIVPEHATTVMVSLDGVLAPMNDGGAVEKKAKTAARGQITKGPAGYREVGCATLSFYDQDGDCLAAVRMARMPEPHKASLKKSLLAELKCALDQRRTCGSSKPPTVPSITGRSCTTKFPMESRSWTSSTRPSI